MSNDTTQRNEIVRCVEDYKPQLLQVLPRDVNADRFFAIALSIAKRKDLRECNKWSILDCIHRTAKLGFDPEPTLGEVYYIPRKVKGVLTACFQPGYRGLTKLARKSRGIADIHAEVAYEGEPFRVFFGTDRRIEHEPSVSVGAEPSRIIAAYATWLDLASGKVNFHVIGPERIARARGMNQRDGVKNAWDTDEAAMARKTALIDSAKFWQLSPDLAEVVAVVGQAERDEPQTPSMPMLDTTAKDVTTSELDEYAEASPAPEIVSTEPRDDGKTIAEVGE